MNIKIEEMNIKAFENSVKPEMDGALKHFEKDITAIRTGKAQSSLVEDLKVECYGTSFSNLKDIASIATPNTSLITIQPWDTGLVAAIEKALLNSQLGVTPQTDGNLIRVELPKMSVERREELIKLLGKKLETAKVSIRNIRKDIQNLIRDKEKSKAVSEDCVKRLNKALQDITDHFTNLIDSAAAKKKAEISSI